MIFVLTTGILSLASYQQRDRAQQCTSLTTSLGLVFFFVKQYMYFLNLLASLYYGSVVQMGQQSCLKTPLENVVSISIVTCKGIEGRRSLSSSGHIVPISSIWPFPPFPPLLPSPPNSPLPQITPQLSGTCHTLNLADCS